VRHFAFRFFPVLTVSLFLLVMDGCGDGSDLDLSEGWTWPTTEKVIGPEGGTIEVTDTTSTVYGVKIEIPAGALAQDTNIVIESKWASAFLPTGVSSDYPIVEFSPDIPFLKDVQISFPVNSIPSGDDGRILSAFYWNSDSGKWIIVPPRQILQDEVIVSTNHFGVWRWGTVSLTEVEQDTMEAWLKDTFGDEEYNDFVFNLETDFEWLTSAIEDWDNFVRCESQNLVLNTLSNMVTKSEQDLNDLVKNYEPACGVCDLTGSSFPEKVEEYIKIEFRYYVADQLVEAMSRKGELLGILGKLLLLVWYDNALQQLNCDVGCMFETAEFPLIYGLVLHFSTKIVLGSVIAFQVLVPCTN
jgi:hypothetical protein